MSIVGIIALAAVLLALLYWFGRRRQDDAEDTGMQRRRIGDGLRRLNANKAKYATLTQTLLAETPDDQLLEAVLSNLWAKMPGDLSGAPAIMQAQSMPRQYVYALYAVTGGAKQDGFVALKAGPDAAFLPVALAALDALDMPQSAALLRLAVAETDADAYQTPYAEAFAAEDGKAKLIAYIRSNQRDFTDLQ